MKKILCVMLSLILLLSSFCVCANAAEGGEMKILVTSDTHWHNVGSVNPDGFYRPRASLGQITALTPLIFDRFLKDAAASDADYIFISGDLTDYGNEDALEFAAILADFEDATGKQIFVVPGNHDIHMSSDPDDHLRFRRIYSRFGWDEALAIDENTSSYTADLKNGYRLMAVNSNKENGGGLITDALFAWMEAQAKQAKQDGKKLIAMMHHQIMEHILLEQTIDGFYITDNHKDVCRLFSKWNVRYTFTGHMHIGDIAVYEGKNPIYDVTTLALSRYPMSYRAVTFTDDQATFETRGIDSLDITNIVPGYSDAQKEMIANDPVKYAYGCMQDSLIEEYIKNFVDPEYLIDALGLETDSAAAKALRRFIPEVLIPLYGEGDTVEAKAKALGIRLPESDYETVADLITAFWGAYVKGDENLGGSSLEGRLILDAAYVLLLANAAKESKAVQALLTNRICANLGLLGVDNLFTRKALDFILTGVFVDKAPADNNVTLPGYETNAALHRLTAFFLKLAEFFRKLFSIGSVMQAPAAG